MFEDLREAFRQALSNFTDEMNRDDAPEAMDTLLRGMHEEVTSANVLTHKLESDLEKARKAVEVEAANLKTCERRRQMAEEIDDQETARIAAEFAAKHRRRKEVIEAKAQAMQEELSIRRSEMAEMVEKFKEAKKQRETLTATTGRTQARASLTEADDLFAELDRMGEKIDGSESASRAASSLDIDSDLFGDPPSEPDPSESIDARLAELKRRMGRE